MSTNNSGTGGCMSTILILLIIGAIFGIVSWGTVGDFLQIILLITIISVAFFGALYLFTK